MEEKKKKSKEMILEITYRKKTKEENTHLQMARLVTYAEGR